MGAGALEGPQEVEPGLLLAGRQRLAQGAEWVPSLRSQWYVRVPGRPSVRTTPTTFAVPSQPSVPSGAVTATSRTETRGPYSRQARKARTASSTTAAGAYRSGHRERGRRGGGVPGRVPCQICAAVGVFSARRAAAAVTPGPKRSTSPSTRSGVGSGVGPSNQWLPSSVAL